MLLKLKKIASFLIKRYLRNFIIILKRVGLRRTLILSYRILKTKVLKYPSDISIEAAGFCNLSCPMCIQAKSMTDIEREKKVLSFENFKKVIDDIKGFAFHISLYYAGEPLLNKNLFKMIDYATKYDILTYINTNGVLLENPKIRFGLLNSGLFRLHVSFDGATPEVYEKYRVGADFQKIKEGIRSLVKERGSAKTPIIAMQMIATKTTLPQIDKYAALAKELGVDKAFLATMYLDQYRQNAPKELLDDVIIGGKYSRYEKLVNGRAIPKRDYSTCPTLNSVYILADGSLLHCCYDYEGEYMFGNVFETDLKKLWKDPKYIKWRNEEAKFLKLPICNSCTATISSNSYWIPVYEKK